MAKDLVKAQPKKSSALVLSGDMNEKDIALLRETYAKGLDDTELKLFLKQAKVMDLNPFKKEIYAVKFKKKDGGTNFSLIVGVNGLRKIAHKTGEYVGCKTTHQYDERGNLYSSTSVVKRLVKGHIAEFEFTALNKEYNKGREQWLVIPTTMLGKCSEMGAMRMAFPQIDGLYDDAELAAGAARQDDIEIQSHPNYDEPIPDFPDEVPPTTEEKSPEIVPGDYVIKLGTYRGKRIKEMPKEELSKYLDWAAKQAELGPDAQEYMDMATAFLREKLTK